MESRKTTVAVKQQDKLDESMVPSVHTGVDITEQAEEPSAVIHD